MKSVLLILLASTVFFFQVSVLGAELRESIEEVQVLAPRIRGNESDLLEKRKNQNTVAEVLGSQQMSRTGDSDAAGGLRRVTGITLIDGKYVFIRGLGERYVQAELNGLTLPSPEPSRRVVPLDLFPTSILESITVQKSFEAKSNGEFGGGLVSMETKTRPEKFFIQGSLSLSEGNFSAFRVGPGSPTDRWGADQGFRRLPSAINSAFKNGKKISTDNFSDAEIDSMGQSLANSYSVTEQKSNLPPGFQIAGGNLWKFGKLETAFLSSAFYGNSAESTDKQNFTYNVGSRGLERDEKVNSKVSEFEYKRGLSADQFFRWSDRLDAGLMYMELLQTSNRTAEKAYERLSDSVTNFTTTEVEWVERKLQIVQMRALAKLYHSEDFNWSFTIKGQRAGTQRYAPDRREYTYELRNGLNKINVDTKGNLRSWAELEEKNNEASIEQDVKWTASADWKLDFKLGIRQSTKDRVSDTLRLKLSRKSSPDGQEIDLTLPPESLFGPNLINKDGFRLSTVADAADSMTGEQRVTAQYIQAGAEFSETWRFGLGLRTEKSYQLVKTLNRFENGGAPTQLGGIQAEDQLPYMSLAWKLQLNRRVQFSISETVARPELREVSDIGYREEDSDMVALGNPKLKQAVIQHFDLRYEDYFSTEEMYAISLFQKNFKDPIEEVYLPSQNLLKSFDNARGAVNRGIEFESRLQMRTLSRDLRFWSQSFNMALIDSKIDLSGENLQLQTTKNRPLQGQSPWILNWSLFYDRSAKGLSGALAYNVIGPRIVQVGTSARPDVYEQPFHQLDLVVGQAIDQTWKVTGRIKNLLNPEARLTQGDEIFQNYRKGIALGLNLTGSF